MTESQDGEFLMEKAGRDLSILASMQSRFPFSARKNTPPAFQAHTISSLARLHQPRPYRFAQPRLRARTLSVLFPLKMRLPIQCLDDSCQEQFDLPIQKPSCSPEIDSDRL